MQYTKQLEEELSGMEKVYIILALSRGEVYGYKLLKEIESLTGRKPSPAKVYGFLSKLKDLGIVEVKPSGPRGKTSYRLTSKGRLDVDMAISRISRLVEMLVGKLVSSCYNCGCMVYSNGFKVKVGEKEVMFCCEHCAYSYIKNKEQLETKN